MNSIPVLCICSALVMTSVYLLFLKNLKQTIVFHFVQSLLVAGLFLYMNAEFIGFCIILSSALICVTFYSFALLVMGTKEGEKHPSTSKVKIFFAVIFSCLITGALSFSLYTSVGDAHFDKPATDEVALVGTLLSTKYLGIFVPLAALVLTMTLAIGFLIRKENTKGVVQNVK